MAESGRVDAKFMLRLKLALVLGIGLGTLPLFGADHHVIFLVDQSGSMFRPHGPGRSWKPNDHPSLGYRVEVVAQILDALQARLDFQRDASTRYTLHVVEFAGDVRDQRPMVAFYDPSDPQASARTVRAAKQKLEALKQPAGVRTGETHTRDGLRRVLEVVRGFRGTASGAVHVLLITDGRPYREENGANVAGSPAYLTELAGLARQLRNAGADFEVIGLVGPEDRTLYWPQWGPFWQGVSDATHRVDNPNEIGVLAESLVRKWLGLPPAVSASNPYYCPPYLKRAVFTTHKGRAGAQVEIRDASGRLLQPGLPDLDWADERTYTRISVDRPVPGLWQLDRRSAGISVELFYRQIRRLEPTSAVNLGIPVTFRYQVMSDTGEVFREQLPTYPITAGLEITEPDGSSGRLSATHQGQGIFVADQPYQFATNGQAGVVFSGKTKLPNGDLVEVFSHADALQVTARELLDLDAGESLPAAFAASFGSFEIEPLLRLVRVAPANITVAAADASSAPDRLLQSRLVGVDGSVPKGWADWSPVGLEGQAYRSERKAELPLLSWDWMLRRPKILYFQVRVDDSALSPRFLVRGLKRDIPTELLPRVDESEAMPSLVGDPLAAAFSVREGWWTYLLLMVPGLAVLAMAGFLGGRLLVRGGFMASDALFSQTVNVIVQQAGGSQETTKNMTGRRRLKLRKRGQVSITIGDWDDPDWQPDKFDIVRLFQPWTGRVMVRLRYPVGGGKQPKWHTTELSEGEHPIRLRGMPEAEGYLVVRRRGRDTREDA